MRPIIYHVCAPLVRSKRTCVWRARHTFVRWLSLWTQNVWSSWWAAVKVRLQEWVREVFATSNIRLHNMHMALFYVHVSLQFSWHMLVPDSLKHKDCNHRFSSFMLTTQTISYRKYAFVVSMLVPYESIYLFQRENHVLVGKSNWKNITLIIASFHV